MRIGLSNRLDGRAVEGNSVRFRIIAMIAIVAAIASIAAESTQPTDRVNGSPGTQPSVTAEAVLRELSRQRPSDLPALDAAIGKVLTVKREPSSDTKAAAEGLQAIYDKLLEAQQEWKLMDDADKRRSTHPDDQRLAAQYQAHRWQRDWALDAVMAKANACVADRAERVSGARPTTRSSDQSIARAPSPVADLLGAAREWRDEQLKELPEKIKRSSDDESRVAREMRAAGADGGAIRDRRKQFQAQRAEMQRQLALLKQADDAALTEEYKVVLKAEADRQAAIKEQQAERARRQAEFDRRVAAARKLFGWDGGFALCPTCIMPQVSAIGANVHNGVVKIDGKQLAPNPDCPTCGGTGLVPDR